MKSYTYYPSLCKMKISLFSAFSAATGFMLTGSALNVNFIIMAAGVFILAAGACSLNQYQERDTDALMDRTKSRPLPAGKISPQEALVLSLILILTGLLLLSGPSLAVSLLGLFAVVWYNGVYTKLKRISAFAPLPGALVGAIPPAIGWSSAGAGLLDPRILTLCVFFFIWQVPHFWFLSLSNTSDYKKAGLPAIGEIFSKEQISRITSVWIVSMAVAGLTLQLYIIPAQHVLKAGLYAAGLWLFAGGFTCIRQSSTPLPSDKAFNRINMYMLVSMLILSGESLLF